MEGVVEFEKTWQRLDNKHEANISEEWSKKTILNCLLGLEDIIFLGRFKQEKSPHFENNLAIWKACKEDAELNIFLENVIQTEKSEAERMIENFSIVEKAYQEL